MDNTAEEAEAEAEPQTFPRPAMEWLEGVEVGEWGAVVSISNVIADGLPPPLSSFLFFVFFFCCGGDGGGGAPSPSPATVVTHTFKASYATHWQIEYGMSCSSVCGTHSARRRSNATPHEKEDDGEEEAPKNRARQRRRTTVPPPPPPPVGLA